MSYLEKIEKGGYKPPEDPDDFDESEDRNTWKEIGLTLLKGIIAVLLVFSVFYIYGGVREFFMFQETSDAVSQRELAVVAGDTELTLPLKAIILRNEMNGSQRTREDVRRMVEQADKIWHQANIRLDLISTEEMNVENDIINNVAKNPLVFLEDKEHDSGVVNVFLSRRLEGINGIAFQGSNSLVVADLVTNYDFRTLAHEVGHVLGLDHITGNRGRLMNQGSNGYIITKKEAKDARGVLNILNN